MVKQRCITTQISFCSVLHHNSHAHDLRSIAIVTLQRPTHASHKNRFIRQASIFEVVRTLWQSLSSQYTATNQISQAPREKNVSAATNWVHRLVAVRQKSEHWAQFCLNSDQWVHPQKSIYGISRFLQWFEQRMWQSLYELHSEPPRVQLVAKTTYFFHWQTASQVLQLIGLYFHFLGARCHSLRKTISPCWRDHWIFFGCITAEKE